MSITFPRGTPGREAMQRIHYGCHGALTSIHHETVDAHARSLRQTISREEFLTKCNNFTPEVPERPDDLDAPLRRAVNSTEARKEVELIYGRIVDKCRADRGRTRSRRNVRNPPHIRRSRP